MGHHDHGPFGAAQGVDALGDRLERVDVEPGVRLVEERELRAQIGRQFGDQYVPESPNRYKTKSKNAQEAHEAVRPTSVAFVPDDIKGSLDEDQYKLYSLIWKRTMACQMVPAVFDTVAIDFAAGPEQDGHVFRANGSVLVEPGFIAVYQEGKDDAKDDEGDRLLPEIEEGDVVDLGSGRRLDIMYTPGHASHHITPFDPGTGVCFVGDVAGIR